jgi:polysaccharide biosynthesis/export protein
MRDFPPLIEPGRPAPTPGISPVVPPARPEASTPKEPVGGKPETEAPAPYHLGVGDELTLLVLGQPDYSKTVKVRPDGAITAPAAGTVFAMGRTAEEVGLEIQHKLGTYLRHPVVNLMVTGFGDQKIYIMGEVNLPGDRPYTNGMTAVQALAQAGGLKPSGQGKSVVVLRRTGPDEAQFYTLNLSDLLGDKPGGTDMALRPYDIVYVPRSFIGSANVFVDQYVRLMSTPFVTYVEGWNAFNIGKEGVRIISNP